jgi:hypothetical protein
MLLQNNIDFGRASILVKMLDPVVVKPDTDSKKASTKLCIDPENIYGRAPAKLIKNQDEDTMMYPSRLVIPAKSCFFLPVINPKAPIAAQIKIEYTNGATLSLYISATITELSIKTGITSKILPVTLNIISGLINRFIVLLNEGS